MRHSAQMLICWMVACQEQGLVCAPGNYLLHNMLYHTPFSKNLKNDKGCLSWARSLVLLYWHIHAVFMFIGSYHKLMVIDCLVATPYITYIFYLLTKPELNIRSHDTIKLCNLSLLIPVLGLRESKRESGLPQLWLGAAFQLWDLTGH